MKQTLRLAVLVMAMMLGSHGGALADDLDDASAAYYWGDYATVLKLIRPFAEQGDAGAQYNLGVM